MELIISSNNLDIPETSFLKANNRPLYILSSHEQQIPRPNHIKCVPIISFAAHVRCTHFCNFCDIVIYKEPGSNSLISVSIAEHFFKTVLQGLALDSKWLAAACLFFKFMVENQENFPNVSNGTEVDPLVLLPVWNKDQLSNWIVSQKQSKQIPRRHIAWD